jgi:signal transduction histidine kinase
VPTAFNQPPYGPTDVIAGILAILAVLYAALWLRDQEKGMGWFALAMASYALWIGTSALHVPSDPVYMRASWWFIPLYLGIAAMALGLVDYLDVPAGKRMPVLAALLLPLVATTAISTWVVLTGALVVRNWQNLLTTSSVAGAAALSVWAARREPGAGHGYVGLAMASLPVLAIGLAIAGSPATALRYWGYLPIMFFGLTLLTVTLLRRRRRLEGEIERRTQAEVSLAALNASLERQVEQRTRELRGMVSALESFNRSVSHDLRGPLGGIGGLARVAEQALQHGDTATAQRLLGPIAEQAESSERLVTALLALARAGDVPLQMQPVDLQALAQEVAQGIVAGDAGAAPIEVGALPTVTGDPDLLRAVFNNLIGNAVKFSAGREGAQVRVDAEAADGSVTVHVCDNGVGFDQAAATRLFESFSRLHGRAYAGSGVGLSIVRRAVERHRGSVRASSKAGQGATFSFTLPRGAA